MYTKSLVFAGLASVASAHIKMSSPVPYGAATLNNSPLEPDGSNFPCKQRAGVYDAAGVSNVFSQGSTQQLQFVGTAVHGGGSCQVSMTTDTEPDANSVWKVIKSIEGGCPAKGADGNIGDDASAPVPFSYDYTIPAELAAGNYTLAWTWQNKIGNRELYMNCAPVTVTGSGGSDSHLDTLPDMFVANIGNGCLTTHGTDVEYPNPGNDVDRFNGATDAFEMPTASACGVPTGGSGGGNGGGVKPTTTAAPSQSSAPPSQPNIPGGVFITVSDGVDAPAPTEAPVTPEPTPEEPVDEPETEVPVDDEEPVDNEEPVEEPVTEAPVVETPGSGSGGDSPSGGFSAGSACDQEGDWNCVGGSSFQRCASGSWSVVMRLAEGVSCKGGQSATLSMAAIKGKRSLRRASRII